MVYTAFCLIFENAHSLIVLEIVQDVYVLRSLSTVYLHECMLKMIVKVKH